MITNCRHCSREIVRDADGRWVDPEATGDDEVWRETCDAHDTFVADHEPLRRNIPLPSDHFTPPEDDTHH